VAAAGVVSTAVWAYELLNRTPSWLPWLRMTVLVAGLLSAAAIFAVPALLARTARARLTPQDGPAGLGHRAARVQVLASVPLALALIAGLGGPLAYSLDTANTTHTGAIPSAGPQVTGAFGRPGGSAGGPGGSFAGPGGTAGRSGTGFGTGAGTGTGTGTAAPSGGTGGTAAGANGTGPGGTGGFPGASGSGTSTGTNAGTGSGSGLNGGTAPGGAQRGFGAAGGGMGGMGGLSGSTEVSSALITLLEQDASRYRWIAATEGSQSAAPIELATGGDAVMAIGGFNGSDPSPTLAQFEAMVAAREIHYYVGQGANSFGGGSGSSAIASWVAAHFTAKTVGGVTVYDLTKQK
jgi:hypothetical protein